MARKKLDPSHLQLAPLSLRSWSNALASYNHRSGQTSLLNPALLPLLRKLKQLAEASPAGTFALPPHQREQLAKQLLLSQAELDNWLEALVQHEILIWSARSECGDTGN